MPRSPTPTKPVTNIPQTPARTSRGLLAVGAMAGKITRPLLGPAGLAEGDILGHWAEIVGPALAATATPERIRFPRGRREAGELTVRVSAGAFALTLQHETPRVLERVNAYFGYRAVERLKVVQGAIPKTGRNRPAIPKPPVLTAGQEQALAGQLADIEDEGLRASLERLGRAVLGGRS